ncbi:hypothetical protein VPNG_05498 [Cytospora leucostoma]|uniref:ASST-domain-containing protein n=1 Tax=Cytospora leucostoma TaxID=1230097 RepID=A0A423XBQ4_9PEZI|nr:hypothetical protein VPNG_05498 [Cytospora leucostoma]
MKPAAVWSYAPVLTATGGRAWCRRALRSPALWVAILITTSVALGLGAAALWRNVLSRLHLHRDLSWYGLGLHGLAPSVRYESFGARAPRLEFPRWDARCSGDYILFGWRGHEVEEPGAVILDARGGLVWRQTGFAVDQNDVKTQVYRGETFLTFQMDGPGGDRSQGYWYMLDESYTVRYRVRPHGFPHADMHEFVITADDTALVITTVPIPYDLRGVGGPERGWLQDCYFQELDVETGALLFQWSAADHFPAGATMEAQDNCRTDPGARFAGCGEAEASAFDYFHLNSVQKDSRGNYLVSARNTWSISYIDGRDGAVLWTLGAGKVNDFVDISPDEGAATSFSWQHHARWVEEGRTISFFDNHYHRVGDPPRTAGPGGESGGRVVDIEFVVPNHDNNNNNDDDSNNNKNNTVRLRAAYNHPNHIRPESQGSIQHLPGGGSGSSDGNGSNGSGNYMVGWGSSGAFTEFSAGGEVLCDGRFGAEAFFEFSPVSSYRVFRGAWAGRPAYPPSAAVTGGSVYASWNGATGVRRWQVERRVGGDDEGGDGDDGGDGSQSPAVEVIAQQFRDGFETEIRLPRGTAGSMIRVVALGGEEGDEVLGASDFLEVPGWNSWGLTTPYNVLVLSGVAVIMILLCVAVVGWICARRRRRQMSGYEPVNGQQGGWKLEDIPRSDTHHRLSGELSLVSPSIRGGGRIFERDAYDT